jgi:hypothetical protein
LSFSSILDTSQKNAQKRSTNGQAPEGEKISEEDSLVAAKTISIYPLKNKLVLMRSLV